MFMKTILAMALLATSFISYHELAEGGELVFTMTNKPKLDEK
ncbi:hypothetical protein SAMN04487898_11677 [Pedobacter sp. ok626]|nr:hypothetical protein SAMN04487898_11677 [Pedobacter sp. ok626]